MVEPEVEPFFQIFVSPTLKPTVSNLLLPKLLAALPNFENASNFQVGPQSIYVVPETALFRNTASLAGEYRILEF